MPSTTPRHIQLRHMNGAGIACYCSERGSVDACPPAEDTKTLRMGGRNHDDGGRRRFSENERQRAFMRCAARVIYVEITSATRDVYILERKPRAQRGSVKTAQLRPPGVRNSAAFAERVARGRCASRRGSGDAVTVTVAKARSVECVVFVASMPRAPSCGGAQRGRRRRA